MCWNYFGAALYHILHFSYSGVYAEITVLFMFMYMCCGSLHFFSWEVVSSIFVFSCCYIYYWLYIHLLVSHLLEKRWKGFCINLCLAARLFWGVFLYKLLFNLAESLCLVLKLILWLFIVLYIIFLQKICCPWFRKFLHIQSLGKSRFLLTSREGGTV